jgi:hypothetical protein
MADARQWTQARSQAWVTSQITRNGASSKLLTALIVTHFSPAGL